MFVNVAQREINLKIVYYGAGLGGKTTNIESIHKAAPDKGTLTSLATEADRTLFFDFLPLEIGKVSDFKVRLHLYTVPGQVFHYTTRRLVVRGADGIVFVADSQEERMDANLEAVWNLQEDLASYGLDIQKIPYVVQLNKRDLRHALPVEEMRDALVIKGDGGEPFVEASAIEGRGVQETLKEVTRLVMRELRETNRIATAIAAVSPQAEGSRAQV